MNTYKVIDEDKAEPGSKPGSKGGSLSTNPEIQLHAAPADPHYGKQMGHFARMDIENAWMLKKGTDDVTIALIDTGVNQEHEDLQDCLRTHANAHRNFGVGLADDINDNVGHGTMLAGILGATTDNHFGIASIGPQTHLLVLRVSNELRAGLRLNQALDALQYVIDGGNDSVRVMLLGWGVPDPDRDAIEKLKEKIVKLEDRVLIVTSAGNDGSDIGKGPAERHLYPALFGGNKTGESLKNVVCVGACHHANSGSNSDRDTRASGSNYSTCKNKESYVDLFSPGVGIYTTGHSHKADYRFESGTSLAAAHVAGVAALLFAAKKDATPDQVKKRLRESSRVPNYPTNPSADLDVTKICASQGILHARQALQGW